MEHPCTTCGDLATRVCAPCKCAYYCSDACLHQHRPQHESLCTLLAALPPRRTLPPLPSPSLARLPARATAPSTPSRAPAPPAAKAPKTSSATLELVRRKEVIKTRIDKMNAARAELARIRAIAKERAARFRTLSKERAAQATKRGAQ